MSLLLTACLLAFLSGATAATLLTCFEKWGWLTWAQVERGRRVPMWLPVDCLFCLGFWLALLLQLALAGALGLPPGAVLLAALPAGAISRALLGLMG